MPYPDLMLPKLGIWSVNMIYVYADYEDRDIILPTLELKATIKGGLFSC